MRFSLAVLIVLLLCGCGRERPLAVTHPVETQTVMASAAHWQALAADVADHLLAAQPDSGLIAVDMPDSESAFGVNFHEMLITELFKRGFDVSDQAQTHVAFAWHVVKHPPVPGEITGKEFEAVGVGAGIYGLYRLARDTLAPTAGVALGGVAAGGLIAGSWIADNVNSEVVITTTVRAGPQHIVYRQTDIYYLETGETENFREKQEHGPTVTYTQAPDSKEGLNDLTQKADAYCAPQHAHASLTRRYVQEGVRYNEFACIPNGDRSEVGN